MIFFNGKNMSVLSKFGFVKYDGCYYHITSDLSPFLNCLCFDCGFNTDGSFFGKADADLIMSLYSLNLIVKKEKCITYECVS